MEVCILACMTPDCCEGCAVKHHRIPNGHHREGKVAQLSRFPKNTTLSLLGDVQALMNRPPAARVHRPHEFKIRIYTLPEGVGLLHQQYGGSFHICRTAG